MNKDFYISYYCEEEQYALWIDKILISKGYSTIVQALDFHAGCNIAIEIDKACQETEYLIIILSTGYLNSSTFHAEWATFFRQNGNRGHYGIIPILVEDNLNVKGILGSLRYIDIPKAISTSKKDELEQNIKDLILEEINAIKENRRIRKDIKFPFSKKVTDSKYLTRELPEAKETFDFVGREEKIKTIEELLINNEKVILVNGLGGIGKTEICKRIYRLHYREYQYLGWIDFRENLKNSLINQLDKKVVNMDPEVDIDENYKRVVKFLMDLDENSLLIIDDVTDLDKNEIELLIKFKFRVIVTSRMKFDDFKEIPIDCFNMQECKQIFYQYYKNEKNDMIIENIVSLAAYHTLTVELLAKTAQNSRKTIEIFYEILIHEGVNFNTINTKVRMRWHKEEDARLFEQILKVFKISSLGYIEINILANLSVLPYKELQVEDIVRWLELDDVDMLNSLIEKGWLKEQGASLIMHKIVQEAVKEQTRPNSVMCDKLISNLSNDLYINPYTICVPRYELIELGKSLLDNLNEDTLNIFKLTCIISMNYKNKGDYDKSIELSMKSIEIFEKLEEKDYELLASSYNNIAISLHFKGKYDKALTYALKAIEIAESSSGEIQEILAICYNTIGRIYQSHEKFEKSLEYYEKSAEIREKMFDSNHPSLATIYNNIAMLYQDKEEDDKALEFINKSIRIKEKIYEAENLSLANSYNNTALIYKKQGVNDKAIQFFQMALKIREKVLEVDHPDLAQIYHNIASYYKEQYNYNEALIFALKAIEIFEKKFSSDHPDLLSIYKETALIYRGLRKYDKAIKYFYILIDIYEKCPDLAEMDLGVVYNNLAITYQDQGTFDKAGEFALKAVKIMEKNSAKCKLDLAVAYRNLSVILIHSRFYDEALEFALKGIEIIRKELGENHEKLIGYYNDLSVIYSKKNEFKKAINFGLKSVRIIESSKKISYQEIITVYSNVAEQYRKFGDIKNSKKFISKILEIRMGKYDNIKGNKFK